MAEVDSEGSASKPKSRRRRRHRSHGSKRTHSPASKADRKWLWLGAAIPVLAIGIGVGVAELNRTPPAPVIDTRPPAVTTPMASCPEPGEEVPPVVRAAACGDQGALRAALAAGASPEQTDSRLRFAGRTPLHHAVQLRRPDLVETLLSAGASSNATDAAGNTPLHLIVLARHHRNDETVARQLLRSGADVQIRNNRHLTPLEELELDHSQLVHRQGIAHVLIGRVREQGPETYPDTGTETDTDRPAVATAASDNGHDPEGFQGQTQEGAADRIEATRTALRLAVAGWAEAWSKHDPAAYLAYYAEDFSPPDGLTPDLWREARRDELRQAEPIALRLSKMEISIDGSQARVRFTQDLDQAGKHTSKRRTLVFGKRGGDWLIVSEHEAR